MAGKTKSAKVIIPRDQYEGLVACQQEHRQLKEKSRAAVAQQEENVRLQNEKIREDLGEEETESGFSPDDPSTGDDNASAAAPASSAAAAAAEAAAAAADDTDDEEIDLNQLLPCRQKKKAAAFLHRLAKKPGAEMKKGHLWFQSKRVGSLPTVLAHLYGQESLSASQKKTLQSLQKKAAASSSSGSVRARAAPIRRRKRPPVSLNGDFLRQLKKYGLEKK